jgi:hypothetical protein
MGANGQTGGQTAAGPRTTHQSTRIPVWTVSDRRLLARPIHPAARALFAYWRSRCGPAGVPRREDIIAAHIPRLLPHIAILEPAPGRHDWRVRLFGTSLAWRYDVDCTSKRVREVYEPGTADVLIETYDRVACDRRPVFMAGLALNRAGESVAYEGAALPILGRDGTTVWVLTGTFFNNSVVAATGR